MATWESAASTQTAHDVYVSCRGVGFLMQTLVSLLMNAPTFSKPRDALREKLRKALIGKHLLKQNILPETEFTYVIPCLLDNLINNYGHEKLSLKAGNQKRQGCSL